MSFADVTFLFQVIKNVANMNGKSTKYGNMSLLTFYGIYFIRNERQK